MEYLSSLDDLIGLVENSTPDADPLQQLTDSVVVAGRISDVADELVGYFVEQARSSGSTWEEIGECMGVSKQAAQKRFTIGGPRRRGGFFLSRLAEEARHVVRSAVEDARELGSTNVGTEHLVLGLLADSGGVAYRAITGVRGSVDEIRSAARSETHPGEGGVRAGGHIPFSPDSKKVLELALRETIRRGDRRIGSEHILLGIVRDGKSPGARVLLQNGVSRKTVESWLDGQ